MSRVLRWVRKNVAKCFGRYEENSEELFTEEKFRQAGTFNPSTTFAERHAGSFIIGNEEQ
eukprot:IDg17162t1